MASKKFILAVDGGGIRGVIPGVILTEIEKKTGKRIAELFDLVVGTSTGGILGAGLVTPDSEGQPKYKAEQLLKIYTEHGRDIFDRSFWNGITLGATEFFDEKYDHGPLVNILKSYFGDATLADCLKPLVITSYDIERRQPYFFKSEKHDQEGRNHMLWSVCRATSAAPTYFEPAATPSENGDIVRYLIDGGVFCNNPALAGYSEGRSMKYKPADIILVSLGTGKNDRKIPYKDARDWGLAGWARPISNVMMDGMSDSTEHHLEHLLPGEKDGDKQRYFRFDIELEKGLEDLDAANAGNIAALKDRGRRILTNQKAEFARLIKLLNPGASPSP